MGEMSKVCAVIGFGPGNGHAIARVFAGEGFQLGLVARSRTGKEEQLKELEDNGARFFAADASKADELVPVFGQIEAELGAPEVLVYNAFAFRKAPASALSPEQLEEDLRLSLVGALVSTRCVLEGMKKAGRGTILFTGGILALEPMPQFASVGIGKAALRNLAFVLARELAPQGIHVATVTIGGFVKPGTRFDPEKIAPKFLELHRQPAGQFETEIVFQ